MTNARSLKVIWAKPNLQRGSAQEQGTRTLPRRGTGGVVWGCVGVREGSLKGGWGREQGRLSEGDSGVLDSL